LKILATMGKEFLLLIRDPGGMALLFLMPLALVVVMALVQDNTFREFQETRIDVLFVDQDRGELGSSIEEALQSGGNIRLVKKEEGKALSVDSARTLVQKGRYKAAVIIPPEAGAALRRKTKQTAQAFLASYGFADGEPDTRETPKVDLQIIFDPVIKANYRQALAGALERILTGLQADWFMGEIQSRFGGITKIEGKKIDLGKMVKVTQKDASEGDSRAIPVNAVQHNVPAWSMFAMFFILYPLAGNFIREREDGSMLRLRLISGSTFPAITGKFAFYLVICLLQLIFMIGAGLYLMPLLGLNRLALGTNYTGIVLAGLAVAMAATGYGLLIAVYFKTAQQALSFGAISVVILAAIGGVWVPVLVMPPIMQDLSPFSPLNWGLSAFNNLFIRSAATSAILPDVLKLMGFALVALLASISIHKARTVL